MRQERVDERGIEVGARARPRISASASSSDQRSLYGRRAESASKTSQTAAMRPGERDLLPREPGRVARAVPALVVGQGDRLGQLQQRRGRPGEDRGADGRVRRITAISSCVEPARLEQDPRRGSRSCRRRAAAACRSSSASSSLMPTARPSASHIRLIRSMWAPGVAVARLGRLRRAGSRSRAGSRAARAVRARTMRSSTTFSPRDPAALARSSASSSRRARRRSPTAQATSGATTARTVPCVEQRRAAAGVAGAEQRARRPRDARAQRAARAAGAAAPSSDGEQARPAGRVAQREAVHRRPDRVGLDLGPGHRGVRGGRRGVDVLEARRGRADHHDPAAERAPGRRGLRMRSEKETVVMCRAGRGSRSGRRRRRSARGRAGGPTPSRRPRRRIVSRPPTACGTRRITPPGDVGRFAGAAPRRWRAAGSRRRRARSCGRRRRSRVVASTTSPARGDGVVEREVLARHGRLGELDVVDDRARAGRAQAVDRPRVQRARERPAHPQVGEGRVVDRHDGDVGGHARLAAEPEARGDRALLRVRRAGRRGPARRARPRSRARAAGDDERTPRDASRRASRAR